MTANRAAGKRVPTYGFARPIGMPGLIFLSLAVCSFALMLLLCAMWHFGDYIIYDGFDGYHGSPEFHGWAVRPMRLYLDCSIPFLPYEQIIPLFSVLPGICAWRMIHPGFSRGKSPR
jgi:hypothetical protein